MNVKLFIDKNAKVHIPRQIDQKSINQLLIKLHKKLHKYQELRETR